VPAAIYARWIDDGAVREAEAANAGAA
jgi:hypothetical protein